MSLIVLFQHEQQALRSTLSSVRREVVREVLVIDDTEHGSRSVMTHLGKHVQIEQTDGATGRARAFNRGVQSSTGRLLAFLVAGDRWVPGSLGIQLRELNARPEAGLVQGLYRSAKGSLGDGVVAHGRGFGATLFTRSAFEMVGLLDCQLSQGEESAWFLKSRTIGLCSVRHSEVVQIRTDEVEPRSQVRSYLPRKSQVLASLRRSLSESPPAPGRPALEGS